jgi:hypothetical protein
VPRHYRVVFRTDQDVQTPLELLVVLFRIQLQYFEHSRSQDGVRVGEVRHYSKHFALSRDPHLEVKITNAYFTILSTHFAVSAHAQFEQIQQDLLVRLGERTAATLSAKLLLQHHPVDEDVAQVEFVLVETVLEEFLHHVEVLPRIFKIVDAGFVEQKYVVNLEEAQFFK